jgi:FkbM family methyltransferase
MKMYLHKILALRRVALPLLKALNRDICIRHPWTGGQFQLALFEHKGYWFHGKNREIEEMLAFGCLVQPGVSILEIGGHIGFASLYFSSLVGAAGKVIVFEPGPNNLPYLKINTAACANVKVEQLACSDSDGQSILFVDNLTGQNNSLIPEFKGLEANALYAPGVAVQTAQATVKTLKVDTYCVKHGIIPDFIKIDVEGHELAVLVGAEDILRSSSPPMIMVEVQADHRAIADLLKGNGYDMFSTNKEQLVDGLLVNDGNIFALHHTLHRDEIKRWRG